MRFKKIAAQILQLMILGTFLAGLIACSGIYDNPEEEARKNYYATDSIESALVSQLDLKRWIDNGYRTDTGKKVVIIDASHTAPSSYIPGAVRPPMLDDLGQWGMGRSDGPVINVGNQIIDGPTMDANLQYAGVDIDTVIVITSNGWRSNISDVPLRAYWHFYYWGFAKANIKVLDGGNEGFMAEFGANLMTANPRTPQASTFSVRNLPGNRIDLVRAAFGDVFAAAKSGAYERREQIIISSQGATASSSTCYGGSNGAAPCYFGTGAFVGLIRGAILLDNTPGTASFGVEKTGMYGTSITSKYYVFKQAGDPDPVVIRDYNVGVDGTKFNLINDKPDKNTRVITLCGSGQSAVVSWFYITNIMGYNNAAIYDGSNSEWLNVTAFRYNGETPAPTYLTNAGVAARSYVKWNAAEGVFYDSKTNTIADKIIRYNSGPFYAGQDIYWDTTRYSDYVSFPAIPSSGLAVDPSYKGNAREINETDKAYMKSKPSDDGAFDGGSTGGSGGVAGC